MSGGIYLIQSTGELVEMIERAYESEDLLQGYLATYPDLLAGDQIDSSTHTSGCLSRERPRFHLRTAAPAAGQWTISSSTRMRSRRSWRLSAALIHAFAGKLWDRCSTMPRMPWSTDRLQGSKPSSRPIVNCGGMIPTKC